MILVLDVEDVRQLAVLLQYLRTHLEATSKEHARVMGDKDALVQDQRRWAEQAAELSSTINVQLRRETGNGPTT